MALFLQELKKIWRPGILVVIVLLGGMYYYIFPSFYIAYFCNGSAAQAEFDLAADWAAQYGPTMEPEERAELDGQLSDAIETFDGLVAAIPEARDEGITSYGDFLAFEDAYLSAGREDLRADAVAEQLRWRIIGGTNYYVVQELSNFIGKYDSFYEYPYSQSEGFAVDHSPAQQARILALESEPYGYMPNSVLHSTWEYGKDLAVWLVLSIVLLLSPTLVRDRLHRTRAMQWTSRRGRRVLHTQLAAGLVSALLLTGMDILIYAVPFLGKGQLIFGDFPVYAQWGYPWVDWTYGQYLLALTALLLVLGLSAGGLTLFLSQYSGNYIAMLLKAIPLFITVGALLGTWLLDGPFFFRYLYIGMISLYFPRCTEVVCITALLLSGLLPLLWSCRRQGKRELAA